MNSRSRGKASRLRQEIRRVQANVDTHMESLLSRRTLLSGSIYEWKRRCGATNCRCTRGDLHRSWVFSYRQGKNLRKVVMTENERRRYQTAVEAQRAFRTDRAKVIEGQRKIRDLLRELEEESRIQMPVRTLRKR